MKALLWPSISLTRSLPATLRLLIAKAKEAAVAAAAMTEEE